MLNKLLSILFIGLAAWGLSFFLPWWSMAIPAAIIGFGAKNNLDAFGKGSAAMVLLWTALCTWQNLSNGGLLANKMGELLGGISGWSLVGLCGVLGGVLGGFSAWTGYMGKLAFLGPPKKRRR
jgi:hypothetical protein